MTGTLARVACLGLSWMSLGIPLLHAGPAFDPQGLGERLAVELVPAPSMSAAELEVVRDQITRIWQRDGVIVDIVTVPPTLPADGRLRVVLTDSSIPGASNSPDLCTLGSIVFVSGAPQSEAQVHVTAIREFVRRARSQQSVGLRSLVAARIVGRVAAHEVGHYVLSDARHTATGLMRARPHGDELLSPHMSPFTPPPRTLLVRGLARPSTTLVRDD